MSSNAPQLDKQIANALKLRGEQLASSFGAYRKSGGGKLWVSNGAVSIGEGAPWTLTARAADVSAKLADAGFAPFSALRRINGYGRPMFAQATNILHVAR